MSNLFCKSQDNDSTVFVVDDDASIRYAVSNLLRSAGMHVVAFSTPAEFVNHPKSGGASCLVLDVRLHGVSGLDFQRQLVESNEKIPIIFISGYADIEMSVMAMKAGAVDFLAKPFRDQNLLDAVSVALQTDLKRREVERQILNLHTNYQSLTVREAQVMALAVKGLMNKQIASQMNLSEVTIKGYRSRVMKKMHAKSFAELVRMAVAISENRACVKPMTYMPRRSP
ncbi:response regulator transcription factor [Pseudomonas sp. KK4]|uniref:response regulator transcription factor n=1 Tax=Pseudomonas sp. KK4 TaxID=1855729 RepID=UPI00097C3138|nr:response regulator [Pseudomonas sp. KK4]